MTYNVFSGTLNLTQSIKVPLIRHISKWHHARHECTPTTVKILATPDAHDVIYTFLLVHKRHLVASWHRFHR